MHKLLLFIVTLFVCGCSDQGFNEYMDEATEGQDMKFYTVGLQDIPNIFNQLSSSGVHGSCAIFAFFPQKINKKEHVEIQYCIENSEIGFDWVFIGNAKYRDQKIIESYFNEHGFEYTAKEMNGVKYLRVVNGDLVNLVVGIISDIYGFTQRHKMELIAARFKIKGLNYSNHDLYSPFYANQ